MRDYVSILRQALRGDTIEHEGTEWSAPYRGQDATGVAPVAVGLDVLAELPILMAAAGPEMVSLAAEVADGWFPPAFTPACCPPLCHCFYAVSIAGTTARASMTSRSGPTSTCSSTTTCERPCTLQGVRRHLVGDVAAVHGGAGLFRARAALADMLADVDAVEAEARVQAGGTLLEGALWQEALDAVPDEYNRRGLAGWSGLPDPHACRTLAGLRADGARSPLWTRNDA